ncbi:MAG: hypothetical protein ACK5L3_05970 [Oscillospiraceae bacterium]
MHVSVAVCLTAKDLQKALRAAEKGYYLRPLAYWGFLTLVFLQFPFLVLARTEVRAPARVLFPFLLRQPIFWGLLACGFIAFVFAALAGGFGRVPGAHCLLGLHRQTELDIAPEGVAIYQNGSRMGCFTYGAVTRFVCRGGLLVLLHKNTLLAVVPTRCFATPGQAAFAQGLIRRGIAAAKPGRRSAALSPTPQQCLWRFLFPIGPIASAQASPLLLKEKPKRWPTALLGLAALLLLCFALAGLRFSFFNPYACGAGFFVAAFFFLRRCRVAYSAKPQLAQYLYGNCVLEIHPHGMRLYNSTVEITAPWADIGGISSGPGLAVIFSNFGEVFPLPFSIKDHAKAAQALAHIQSSAAQQTAGAAAGAFKAG